MSESLIEPIARAIYEAEDPPSATPWHRRSEITGEGLVRGKYLRRAAAALAAIESSGTHVVCPLEPTEAMADRGESALICGPEPRDLADSPGATWAAAKSCWRAMLAARPRDE